MQTIEVDGYTFNVTLVDIDNEDGSKTETLALIGTNKTLIGRILLIEDAVVDDDFIKFPVAFANLSKEDSDQLCEIYKDLIISIFEKITAE